MENVSNTFGQLLTKACSETAYSSGEESSFDKTGYCTITIDQMKNLAYNFNQVLKNKQTYVESRTDKETVLLTIVDHPKEYHHNNNSFLDKKFRDDIKVWDENSIKIENFSFGKSRIFWKGFDNKLKNNRYFTSTHLTKDEVKSITSTITIDELDSLMKTCENCGLDTFKSINPWFKLPEIYINFYRKTSQFDMKQIVLPLKSISCESGIYNLEFYEEIACENLPNTNLAFGGHVSLDTKNCKNSTIDIIVSKFSDLSYKNGDKIVEIINDIADSVRDVTLSLPDRRSKWETTFVKKLDETEQKNCYEYNEFQFDGLSDDIIKYLVNFTKNEKSDIKIVPKLTLYSNDTIYTGFFDINKSKYRIDDGCLNFDGKDHYECWFDSEFIVTCKSANSDKNITCLFNLQFDSCKAGIILSKCKIKICDNQAIKFHRVDLNINIEDTSIHDQKFTYLNGYTDGDVVDVLDFTHFCLSVNPVYRYAFLTELNALYFQKIEQNIQKIDINFLHGGSDLDEGYIEKIIIRTKIVR